MYVCTDMYVLYIQSNTYIHRWWQAWILCIRTEVGVVIAYSVRKVVRIDMYVEERYKRHSPGASQPIIILMWRRSIGVLYCTSMYIYSVCTYVHVRRLMTWQAKKRVCSSPKAYFSILIIYHLSFIHYLRGPRKKEEKKKKEIIIQEFKGR